MQITKSWVGGEKRRESEKKKKKKKKKKHVYSGEMSVQQHRHTSSATGK
jgi:hypothetical protein